MKHFVKAIVITHHDDDDYEKYIEKHGKHFTKELAEYVSGLMENADGTNHTWAVDEVENALKAAGYETEGKVTKANINDIAYLANMYYADMYPDPLKTSAEVIMAANRTAQDPDGYEGMVFCKWHTDAKGKGVEIDWKKFT